MRQQQCLLKIQQTIGSNVDITTNATEDIAALNNKTIAEDMMGQFLTFASEYEISTSEHKTITKSVKTLETELSDAGITEVVDIITNELSKGNKSTRKITDKQFVTKTKDKKRKLYQKLMWRQHLTQ